MPTKDTKHSTFLSLTLLLCFLSAGTSLESSDCSWLLSNRNPVETVSQRQKEKGTREKKNRCNQSGCLCLAVILNVITIKIQNTYIIPIGPGNIYPITQ